MFRRLIATMLLSFTLTAPAWAAGLTVVATTGMIGDTARQIAGDRAEVQVLMGPGVDPHAYRQTRTDIVAMTRADLVLWNGHYLEAQLEEFLLELATRKPVVAVAEAVEAERLLSHEDYEGRFDPHVWMVPELWEQVAIAIRDALIAADPNGAATYTANAAAFEQELDRIGTYAKEVLMTVPEPARVLISAHDAFGYFGAEYGFEVLGIQGISTESEAGLRRIEELVDLLVTREIGAVFVESSVSDRNVRALIEGAAAQGHTVTIGGELFSDAMGETGTYEGTYIGMIDHNATVITRALGGQAPAMGLNTQLGGSS
ncbi:manganese/zinc/iron transport system substrate-binding protein [Rubricella aquisinus]|uniref:Manganese/zinc/iron transport system substrate-binding protein n=1 Tax=Rubricella aquisinus TaxID=2028108 RepID=A0A840X8J1_9RHOB|nr:manganese/zinc/iron transport system substrate-binding protein [Rubricella aquisinus]